MKSLSGGAIQVNSMHPQHSEFDTFYDDQVESIGQLYRRENVWDRLSEPTIIISFLIFLVTVVYNTHASSTTLGSVLSLAGTCLWDFFVFIIPESLLDIIDDWVNPSLVPRPMLDTQGPNAAKSEKMKRVLGLDRSGGVMASVLQVRTRALSMTGSVLGLKLDSQQPAGLGNRDNSCYQNSILQGLASLRTLPEYLSSHLQAQRGDSDVAHTLKALISDLNDASNNGRTLWTPNVLKNMSTWTQQDAQEYYSKILDDIDKSVAQAAKEKQRHSGFSANEEKDDAARSQHSDDSGYQSVSSSSSLDSKHLRNPLEGLLAQRVACVQCGHSDGLSMIPFTCLTLSLGLDKNQHDLYERLDAYSKVEAIENVECAKCTLLKAQRLLSKLVERMRENGSPEAQLSEPLRRLEAVELALEEDDFAEKTLLDKCKITSQSKVSTTKTKQIVVARPPQSLAIHVNRSVFDPSTFNMMKNSAPMNFPKTLDLGPWCLGSAGASAMHDPSQLVQQSTVEMDNNERWVEDPRESMVAGDLNPSRISGPIYELRAVVTHYGRHENGHYICYRKHGRNITPMPAKVIYEEDENVSSEPGDEDEAIALTDIKIKEQEGEFKDEASEEIETDWWRLSDHNVSMVNEETVLSLSPGVFMLFYDCVDPNMVIATDDGAMKDAEEMAEPTVALNEISGDAESAPEPNSTKFDALEEASKAPRGSDTNREIAEEIDVPTAPQHDPSPLPVSETLEPGPDVTVNGIGHDMAAASDQQDVSTSSGELDDTTPGSSERLAEAEQTESAEPTGPTGVKA